MLRANNMNHYSLFLCHDNHFCAGRLYSVEEFFEQRIFINAEMKLVDSHSAVSLNIRINLLHS